MTKEKTAEELIAEFERNYICILSIYTDIRYYDGLRHVSGLIPKNDDQKKLEKELEEKSFLAEQLKNEIAQCLGAEVEVAKMGMNDFRNFLLRRQRSF